MSARPPIKLTVSRARMYEVIRAPLITEKTTNGSEHSQVTFKVAADATKPAVNRTGATPQTQANQGQAATPEAGQVDGAEKPKRKKRKAAKAKPAETEQSVPLFGRQ